MKTRLNRFVDEKLVTQQEARLYARDVYIKVMEKSLITSDTTGRAIYVTYQLLWSVAMRTGFDSQNALDHLAKVFHK